MGRAVACVVTVLALLVSASSAAAQGPDACPNGWSPEQTVSFAPPVPAVDSGVRNPERADGCTLLDVIWEGEPFASHDAFVAAVARASTEFGLTARERSAVVGAAARSDVARRGDRQIDNSCPNRIALTFDDGTSYYRPRLLQVLRDKRVHATFFDNGMRVEANPRIAAFQVREGHVELNHTYTHVHMDQLTPEANREEVLHNEAVLAAAGAPITFKGIRPPFGGSNPAVQALLNSMGYTSFLNRINTEDWLPERTAAEISDAIVAQLRPGVIVGMHDGPVDTPAGAATVEAVGQIIDRARALGYCFGVVDHTGQVIADRYVPTRTPIPRVVNPVPYIRPLAFGTPDQIEGPWRFLRSPLRISATHSPARFAPGQTDATLTLTVSNRSDRPGDGSTVTVTDEIPAGLTATAASGSGWTCTGTTTVRCRRTDALAPGADYPPITIAVTVAPDAPATITNAPTLSAHGSTWFDDARDRIAVGADACPNGWSPEQTVSFAPPVPAVDSGVRNPERADGCTLLDVIWEGEPFASHDAFVAAVARASAEFGLTPRDRAAIVRAAARSDVGTRHDQQIDNSCPNRIALTFDDGPSFYRPRLLRLLREKQVHAAFADNGVRVDANPHIARFQAREGHLQINHTYYHPHMNQLSPAALVEELRRTEAAFAVAGAPLAFKGMRPPFAEANAQVRELIGSLGYAIFDNHEGTDDYDPARTAAEIRDAMLAELRPGLIMTLHDGPIDTPAGAATVEAVGQIIDRAREQGYCFGLVDRHREVVASRYVSSGRPIPEIADPVPYIEPLAFGEVEALPRPFTFIRSALEIAAAHEPATFERGGAARLTLTVSNRRGEPTDGSRVRVTDALPPGLVATAAAGEGWTCTGTETVRCDRNDVLAPHGSYPPITITVRVAADAPATIVHAPTVSGHGGVWFDAAREEIGVG